jgi:hypothetical protein
LISLSRRRFRTDQNHCAEELAENIRSFEEQADEWGGLKPLVGAAKVPKVSRIKKRLVDAAVNIRADEG